MTVKIPISVALVQDFVNTLDVETGKDDLAEPASLRAWLAAHGLGSAEGSPSDLRRAARLRAALRDLLLANNHVGVDTDAARTVIEGYARRGKIELRFSSDGALVPVAAAGGIDGALGTVVAAAARSMDEGTWTRLKACRAETCQWAYYDHTRNHSRAWCSMEVCGNREKVRAYRSRHSAV
jgi:predicted RNA-binding Zn ribbon-like protein